MLLRIEAGIKIQWQPYLLPIWEIFEHVFGFVCTKKMIQLIRSLITCLQGKLAEVYFGIKKVEKINHIYNETHEKGDE